MQPSGKAAEPHALRIWDKTAAGSSDVWPNMMRKTLRTLVCLCVFVSSLYGDTARRHKAPLYMLWRKHSELTQKPLCLQA